MKPSIAAKLAQLAERLDEVNRLLSSEDATRDMDAFRKLNRERTEIEPVVALYHAHQACESDIAAAQEMASDPDMREFADAEIKAGREQLEQLEIELQKQLLPKDPNDDRNVILEVRAGTGGDEAAIFAGDIFRMYVRFAERKRWQVEIISESLGEKGGYKEVIARIVGQGAYSVLKFESGAHRVQRVPATEAQGRIHTSACTVAILPEADEVGEVELNPVDLRIDTFRASRRGRPAHQQDRLRRAHHPPAHWHGGGMPGRALAAPEQGTGHARAGGAHQGQAGKCGAQQVGCRAQIAGRQRRPFRAHSHLQFSARSRHRPSHQSHAVQNGSHHGRRDQ